MRLYVPTTVAELGVLAKSGSLVGPLLAFAVTPTFAAWVGADGPADDEELEFAALAEAARGSLRLLALHGGPAVRAVLAVEVAAAEVVVLDGPDGAADAVLGSVRIERPLVAGDVVSFHLDDPEAAPAVRAAAAAVGAADDDDAAAEAVVEACSDLALSWYLPEELPAALGERS